MKGLKKRRVFKTSLEELLKDIMDNVEGVKAAQLSADTGQPLASVLPSTTDDMRLAAITAALCSLSERAIGEMGLGEFEQSYIQAKNGYLLVLHAGEDQVLTVSTTKDVKLAPILYKHYKNLEDGEEIVSNTPNL
ncbi:MAG TPA: roadblock/LC7 domain-containing protein [Candidatus Nanopelagicaceae bacterium]|nr:roadblock/LC7 domain-containing protein [Candidatus Nanopelagicaceae bacterium]